MNQISLVDKKLGKIGRVLAGDTSNQRNATFFN